MTDDETQSQIELDFDSPDSSISGSDDEEDDDEFDDPFAESYIERRRGRRRRRSKTSEYYYQKNPSPGILEAPQRPDSGGSSSVRTEDSRRSRHSDSGYSQSTNRLQAKQRRSRRSQNNNRNNSNNRRRDDNRREKSNNRQSNNQKEVSKADTMKGYVVGAPERDVYGSNAPEERNNDYDRSNSRLSKRGDDEPERPNWGFGPSRAASRMEEGYIDHSNGYVNDYDSEDDRSRRGEFSDDDDFDDDRGRKGRSKHKKGKKGKKGNKYKNARIPGAPSSKFHDEVDKYRGTKVTLYKNGDPWFGSLKFRFMLGKDFKNLDGLFVSAGKKMNIPNGVNYMFDTDGGRITSIDQVFDGGEYVCSATKKFVPGNYGRTGDAFLIDGGISARNRLRKQAVNKNILAGKPNSADGKIIKIVSAEDYEMSERVLLNLRTTQAFEDVVADLGQVLRIRGANKLYTKKGREVRSFSHLKMDFSNENTFIVASGAARVWYEGSDGEGDDDDNLSEYGYGGDDRNSRASSPTGRRGRGRSLVRYNSEPNLTKGIKNMRNQSKSPMRDTGDAIKVTIQGSRRLVYPPSDGVRESTRAPTDRLKLDWVFGCRGRDVQGKNLHLLENENIAYFCGAIAVIYDRSAETQRHYTEHTEDIECMAVHPSGEYLATGQRSGPRSGSDARCHVRVWNAMSLETKAVLGMGECDKGICAVAFSSMNKGDYVMCVDKSKEATLSVWDWRDNELLGRAATDASLINGCVFHPLDNNLSITYGRGHLVFWSRRKDGFFERSDVVKGPRGRNVTAVEFLESGDLVVGDTDGIIATYSVSNEGEYYMSHEFEAHKAKNGAPIGINCLLMVNEHFLISGGDGDRMIITWDATRDFERMGDAQLPDSTGDARAIITQKKQRHSNSNAGSGENLFVSTTRNCIVEGSTLRKFNITLWSHYGDMKALAVHPDDLAFVTAGITDRTVAKWRKQKVAWKVRLQGGCSSVTYHPSGNVVAVGTDDGHLIVLEGESGTHVTTIKIAGAAINAVAFSPEGGMLAAASQNGALYLYKTGKNGTVYRRVGKMSGTQQGFQQLDWNSRGDYIMVRNLSLLLIAVT